jgi:hypothetical protein
MVEAVLQDTGDRSARTLFCTGRFEAMYVDVQRPIGFPFCQNGTCEGSVFSARERLPGQVADTPAPYTETDL